MATLFNRLKVDVNSPEGKRYVMKTITMKKIEVSATAGSCHALSLLIGEKAWSDEMTAISAMTRFFMEVLPLCQQIHHMESNLSKGYIDVVVTATVASGAAYAFATCLPWKEETMMNQQTSLAVSMLAAERSR